MSYGHKLGYLPFNAGVTVKVRSSKEDDEANAATRQLSEVDVRLLIRACSNRRDRVLIETAYAGGLRISELVGLTWGDAIARDKDRLQLNVRGNVASGGRC